MPWDINDITWIWILLACVVFPINLRIKANYGRHAPESKRLTIDNKWGWILMELPTLLLVPILFFVGSNEGNTISFLLCAMWTAHYVHRTLIFPFRIRTKGKRMPIYIMLAAIFFNLANGGLNGYSLGFMDMQELPYRWNVWSGVLVFFLGAGINLWADTRLINLRKEGETGYVIPTGGLFNRISCPNHLGETIQWLGFALAAFSLPALSFAIWTCANLIPRAIHHHQWYKKKFDDYPPERKALIPGIL